MTDEELIKRLRHGEGWPITAADRIEELVKEKKQNGEDYCALMEKHDALHVKLTKAIEALRFYTHDYVFSGNKARAVLAELEGKE